MVEKSQVPILTLFYLGVDEKGDAHFDAIGADLAKVINLKPRQQLRVYADPRAVVDARTEVV